MGIFSLAMALLDFAFAMLLLMDTNPAQTQSNVAYSLGEEN